MLPRIVVVLLVTACSGKPVASALNPSVPSAKTSSAPPPTQPMVLPPTLVTAGAQTCQLGDAVRLGPAPIGGTGAIVIGFANEIGIVTWTSADAVLTVQPINREGAVDGAAQFFEIPANAEPERIRALDYGFEVMLRHWDWHTQTLTRWTIDVDRQGHAIGPPVVLVQPDDASLPMLDDDPDKIEANVTNGAIPPAPRANGRIYEMMGQAEFARTHGGMPVGRSLSLSWNGTSVAQGTHVDAYVGWSGLVFLYPFTRDERGTVHIAYLLPIDCSGRMP